MNWRIAENEYNLQTSPWSEAIGIEDMSDGLDVPGVVCWITRGSPAGTAKLIAAAPELLATLAEILACRDAGDGFWDMDGGGPGECNPYTSDRLEKALERAEHLVK